MKIKGRGSYEEVISGDGQVIMTKWFDNKPVVMASNLVTIGIGRRWDKKDKEYKDIPRPQVIKKYNKHMGGVDLLDFIITLYRTFIRSKKWTLRMFTHAIDLSCTNACIEYKNTAEILKVPKKNIMDLLHFRAYVAESLILVNQNPVKKRGRPLSSNMNSPKRLPTITTSSVKRAREEIRPLTEVRLDTVGHICRSLTIKRIQHVANIFSV